LRIFTGSGCNLQPVLQVAFGAHGAQDFLQQPKKPKVVKETNNNITAAIRAAFVMKVFIPSPFIKGLYELLPSL